MPESQPIGSDASSDLIEHCAQFASKHGVDNMLDLIAGVHQAYAKVANDPNIKLAYELAGVPLQ